MIRTVSQLLVRMNTSRSRLLTTVAEDGGMTSLHYAVKRGDMEIVELLLEHGADPSIKSDLGRDVLKDTSDASDSIFRGFPTMDIFDGIEQTCRG